MHIGMFKVQEIAWLTLRITLGLALLTFRTTPARSQESATHGEDGHTHGRHFAHPLFTESVSPDTKLRANTGREWETNGGAWQLEMEGEYAFDRSFSIEVGVPYVILQPSGQSSQSGVGYLEVLFKFANFAFEERGLLLGYGIEFGVPTGDADKGIGSDHIWEIAPVLNLGYRVGRVELVGFTMFGIPFAQRAGEDVETELIYNGSALVHMSSRLQLLVEANAETVLSGAEAGATVVRLSPGVKVAPSGAIPLFIGIGASLPLTESELDGAALVSLFYHF